jgi:hypothetical protein
VGLLAKLTKIDAGHLRSHCHLSGCEECYVLGDYAPGEGSSRGGANHLILDLKMGMDRRGEPGWQHKQQAIEEAARQLAEALAARRAWLAAATLVPMPPSRARGDPLYDDRMLRVLRSLARICGLELDIRELVYQAASTRASSRSGGNRLTLPELRANYRIDAGLLEPSPGRIGLFDDLLTSGAHFRAASELLRQTWPKLRVTGIFLARSVR